MLQHGIDRKFLNPYIYPSDDEVKRVGVTGIFLGSFLKWNIKNQLEKVCELGFTLHDGPSEGTFTNYENLDNKIPNKELFKKDGNGNLLRDELGNLEKINYDNLE